MKKLRPLDQIYFLIAIILAISLSGHHGFAVSTSGDSANAQKTVESDLDSQGRPLYQPGTICIELKEGTCPEIDKQGGPFFFGLASLEAKAARFEVSGLTKRFRHRPLPKNSNLPDLSRIYKLRFPAKYDVRAVVRSFSQDPNVEYAEPIFFNYACDLPNDPLYDQQQHLPQIMAEQAWDIHKGEEGDSVVVIAIADSGVDWDHPDLIDNIWQNPGEDADNDGQTLEWNGSQWIFDPGDENGIDDDANGFIDDFIGWDVYENNNDPDDPDDHGTHVAGIAAGVTNNETGIASISWNVKIMALSSWDGQFLPNAYDMCIYAAENGADIINCSWGSDGYSESEEAVIAYVAGLGSIVVAAAGNANTALPHTPSSLPHVLSVAALGDNDVKAAYSNFGPGVDIAAPGGGPPGPGILSTIPGGGYGGPFWSGTSMASPLAAGLLGLLKSFHPDWSNEMLELQFLATADDIDAVNPDYMNMLGTGRINAFHALADENVILPQELRLEWRDLQITDSNDDGIYEPGETGTISFRIRNYTHQVSADYAIFSLTSTDPAIEILNGTYINSIPADGYTEADEALSFQIPDDAESHIATLTIGVEADVEVTLGSEIDFEIFIVSGGVYVWEGVENGLNYSGAYIRDIFTEAGAAVTYSTEFLPSFADFEAVFLSFGNYGIGGNQRTHFSPSMATTVLSYLENGGKVYIEGGDAFFEQQFNDDLLDLFGLASVENGSEHLIENLEGQLGTFAEGLQFSGSSQAHQKRIDLYETNDSGSAAFIEGDYGTVAVQNESGNGRKTICFSYALSKLSDEDPRTRRRLSAKILGFFDLPHLVAEFYAENLTGHAPLTVDFYDMSSGLPGVVEAAWDFDNDGTVDSNELNPAWTYTEPGSYSVSLEVTNGAISRSFVREDYIHVFDGESALLFDGQEGYGLCSSSPGLNLTDAVTLEAWIKPSGWGAVPIVGQGRIVDKGNISLFLNGTGGMQNTRSLALQLMTGGNLGTSFTPVSSMVLDEWQHVAVTYNGSSSEIKMYIDGQNQSLDQWGSQPAGNIEDNSDIDLLFGNGGDLDWAFDGAIDEVRLWNTVRSEADIQNNMQIPLSGNEPGLIGYWQMNEGRDQVFSDAGGDGFDGLLTDATWTEGYDGFLTIEDDQNFAGHLPDFSHLGQSYPNPWFINRGQGNPSCTIPFVLPQSHLEGGQKKAGGGQGKVNLTLSIYDISGRRVKMLIANEQRGAGSHSIQWDGHNEAGLAVNSGIYLYRLEIKSPHERGATGGGDVPLEEGQGIVQTRRMIVLK
ncbi:MAG: S8 family serine peptidase [Planctomycetes bacterium]|nr:S8 family serine peptidase [Planctomycetota bacterium]